MKDVLFVTYGSGHVRMVVPVARALAESGLARPRVLGLTTAAPVVRAAGLELLQFRDFVRPQDAAALGEGRRLLDAMTGPIDDPQESVAYLGLCYQELVQTVGVEEAARRYARDGRQAFLPLQTVRRIVSEVAPSLVVATNSPRAERAAIEAAGALGLPSVCLVDLFCLDEVQWIGQPGYANTVCVLNDAVRQFLRDAGRRDDELAVTGNPAFDALADAAYQREGRAWREARGWSGRRVLLWPTQVEPAFHPFNGRPGDTSLPQRALDAVIDWVRRRDDAVLCVRPRAGEALPRLPDDPRFVVTGQELALPALLQAVDVVVTLNSTVGLEGHLAGTRLVQVLGSVFDDAMPLLRYGIADAAVPVEGIARALDACPLPGPRKPLSAVENATTKVMGVLRRFL
jgi:hypothetical protein